MNRLKICERVLQHYYPIERPSYKVVFLHRHHERKTVLFHTDNSNIFDFFQRYIWREKEMGQEKFGQLKFCLVQKYVRELWTEYVCTWDIQFTSRLSEKKSQTLGCNGDKSRRNYMPIILAAMRLYEDKHYVEKIEWGQLSLGRGFIDYKKILDESFNAYYDLKAKRILEKPVFKNKITKTIFNLLLIKRI